MVSLFVVAITHNPPHFVFVFDQSVDIIKGVLSLISSRSEFDGDKV